MGEPTITINTYQPSIDQQTMEAIIPADIGAYVGVSHGTNEPNDNRATWDDTVVLFNGTGKTDGGATLTEKLDARNLAAEEAYKAEHATEKDAPAFTPLPDANETLVMIVDDLVPNQVRYFTKEKDAFVVVDNGTTAEQIFKIGFEGNDDQSLLGQTYSSRYLKQKRDPVSLPLSTIQERLRNFTNPYFRESCKVTTTRFDQSCITAADAPFSTTMQTLGSAQAVSSNLDEINGDIASHDTPRMSDLISLDQSQAELQIALGSFDKSLDVFFCRYDADLDHLVLPQSAMPTTDTQTVLDAKRDYCQDLLK